MFLDHIFIITEPNAPAAQRLSAIGLQEGNSNIHPGQGTSNRRFFVENSTIELLFVHDSEEAALGTGNRLGILSRFSDVNASPFGIVVRVTETESIPDFPAWQYYPDYFPDHMCFYVGDNSDQLEEPLCICMPPGLAMSKAVPDQYANPNWRLTKLEIQLPITEQSVTLQRFASIKNVVIKPGQSHLMTLTFNNGLAGRSENLMPDLPLIIVW
jgi:hypothetical protein